MGCRGKSFISVTVVLLVVFGLRSRVFDVRVNSSGVSCVTYCFSSLPTTRARHLLFLQYWVVLKVAVIFAILSLRTLLSSWFWWSHDVGKNCSVEMGIDHHVGDGGTRCCCGHVSQWVHIDVLLSGLRAVGAPCSMWNMIPANVPVNGLEHH